MWRELRKTDEIFSFAEIIWQKENSLPNWFKNANKIWNENFEEFEEFLRDCGEIYGLFFENKLCLIVYVEKQFSPDRMNIHLSVIEKIPMKNFIRESETLRTLFLRRGVKKISGWVLKKNIALCALLLKIGFFETGLEMKHGVSHGKVLKWSEFVLRGN